MCKEMLVILVNKMVDPKRIIRKNGGLRRRRGTRVADPKKQHFSIVSPNFTSFYIACIAL
jgi:hypothetical protein